MLFFIVIVSTVIALDTLPDISKPTVSVIVEVSFITNFVIDNVVVTVVASNI